MVKLLGPLFFLIHITDLAEGISSTAKLFADDTSIFSVDNDINASADQINKYLEKISMWAYQWKIVFSKKNRNVSHLPLYFNKTHVTVCSYKKHLGVCLVKKLSLQHHIKGKKMQKQVKEHVLLQSCTMLFEEMLY